MKKMRVTKQQILKELTTLDLCQSALRRSDNELQVITERWFEIIDKQFMSSDVFHDAVVNYQEQSEWFPTVKDILECVKSVWETRKQNIKLLPEPDCIPPTKEEMAENRKRLDKIFEKNGILKSIPATVNHKKRIAKLRKQAKQILTEG